MSLPLSLRPLRNSCQQVKPAPVEPADEQQLLRVMTPRSPCLPNFLLVKVEMPIGLPPVGRTASETKDFSRLTTRVRASPEKNNLLCSDTHPPTHHTKKRRVAELRTRCTCSMIPTVTRLARTLTERCKSCIAIIISISIRPCSTESINTTPHPPCGAIIPFSLIVSTNTFAQHCSAPPEERSRRQSTVTGAVLQHRFSFVAIITTTHHYHYQCSWELAGKAYIQGFFFLFYREASFLVRQGNAAANRLANGSYPVKRLVLFIFWFLLVHFGRKRRSCHFFA